jgi:hypothetical protein
VEKYDRARQSINDSIIRRMRIACWMTEARKQTHSWYLILTAFARQQWLRQRPSVLRYAYISGVFFYKPIFVNIFVSLPPLEMPSYHVRIVLQGQHFIYWIQGRIPFRSGQYLL